MAQVILMAIEIPFQVITLNQLRQPPQPHRFPRDQTFPAMQTLSTHSFLFPCYRLEHPSHGEIQHAAVTSNGTHMISSIGLSQCGTTVTITKDNVEFENELKAQSTNSTANSLIDFGEDAYVIPVKCIYPRTETPMTSYVPLQQHVRFYEKRYGHFDVDIMQYDSDKFSSAIQNLGTPRKVALNSEIYVEVKLNDQFNNGLGIHIDKCIATPTSSPSDSTLYTLLTDGCPASQHVHLYNSPANKVRFGIRAFQFTSQTGAMVYIHCQTSMCQAGTPYCTSNCVTAGTPIRMSTIVASVSAFVAVVACVVAIVGWTRKTRTTSTKEQGLL
ncbi:hypothetical protein FSP39_017064 [Pinctada imbricata]|uniref:ZP domain-containing protein n=1 Tax=Pinctada imbricata TaxID=66713 RepID=A0AA89BXI8_PINIB|nr:hypothetical protein FSP39_017064 [Pinctada imbricata]